MIRKKELSTRDTSSPCGGGLVLFNSDTFKPNQMDGICPTLRAEKNDAGVCVEYDDEG